MVVVVRLVVVGLKGGNGLGIADVDERKHLRSKQHHLKKHAPKKDAHSIFRLHNLSETAHRKIVVPIVHRVGVHNRALRFRLGGLHGGKTKRSKVSTRTLSPQPGVVVGVCMYVYIYVYVGVDVASVLSRFSLSRR